MWLTKSFKNLKASHPVTRNLKEMPEGEWGDTFGQSNMVAIDGTTYAKDSGSIQFPLLVSIFCFIFLFFTKLCSSPHCTKKSQIPDLLAMSSVPVLTYELSQWKEMDKETLRTHTAQFLYRFRKVNTLRLE